MGPKVNKSLTVIHGDIIAAAKEGCIDYLIHGCNCFHTMGAGVAYSVAKEWPHAYNADTETKCADGDKLGTYSWAKVSASKTNNKNFYIINAYTQYGYKRGNDAEPPFFIEHLSGVFATILKSDKIKGKTIGMPFIGGGLGQGDKTLILLLMDWFAAEAKQLGCNVVLYLRDLSALDSDYMLYNYVSKLETQIEIYTKV